MESENIWETIGKIQVFKNKELGRGSNGVLVFEGSFEDIPVAVKRISIHFLSNEVDLLKTNNSHENIVRYFASEKNDDFVYIAMELCAGTLENLVNDTYRGPTVGNMNEVLRQTTLGLQYLHEKRIVHRDLKPQNVLISKPDGTVPPKIKLADFGISRRQTSERYFTKTGTAGTCGWSAPEFYDETRDRYDYSVDVFSLGCVFGYTLSGGNHPFGEADFRIGNIKRGTLEWAGEKTIRNQGTITLVKAMINAEPKRRPKICDILQHPFLSQYPSAALFRASSSDQPKIPREGDLVAESVGVRVYRGSVNKYPRAIKRISVIQYPTNYKKELEILTNPLMANCGFLLRYFSHEEDADFCYIEMELCIDSIEQVFRNYESFNIDLEQLKNRVFMRQILEGLVYLHKMSVVHRDLKPSNVLVQQSNDGILIPKIADYGISETVDNRVHKGGLRSTTLFRGTDGWKAPELKLEAVYTVAVDVFAAGCLLFYIETLGSHPFRLSRHDSNETIQRNIDMKKPNIGMLKSIEPTLLDLICRALEPDALRRLSSEEMLDHAVFKSSQEALECFREAVEKHFKAEKMFPNEDEHLKRIVIFDDWRAALEPEVLEEATKGLRGSTKQVTQEMGQSIYHLLLLIRNKHAHFYEMDQKMRDFIGEPPERYLNYWQKKFPHLFIRTWNAIKQIPTPQLQLQIDSLANTAIVQPWSHENLDSAPRWHEGTISAVSSTSQRPLDHLTITTTATESYQTPIGIASPVPAMKREPIPLDEIMQQLRLSKREMSVASNVTPSSSSLSRNTLGENEKDVVDARLVKRQESQVITGIPQEREAIGEVKRENAAASLAHVTLKEIKSLNLKVSHKSGSKFIDGLWFDTAVEKLYPFKFIALLYENAINHIEVTDSLSWMPKKDSAFRHNFTCMLPLESHVNHDDVLLVLGDHMGVLQLYCTRARHIVTSYSIPVHSQSTLGGVKRLELSPEKNVTEIIVQYSKIVCFLKLEAGKNALDFPSTSCSCKNLTFKLIGSHDFAQDTPVQAITWFGEKVSAVAFRNHVNLYNGPEEKLRLTMYGIQEIIGLPCLWRNFWLMASSALDGKIKVWIRDESSHIPIDIDEKWTFSRHTQKVTALTWLPNKSSAWNGNNDTPLIASGCTAGFVFIWNALSGEVIHELRNVDLKAIISISFSPIGNVFVTASSDKSVNVWNCGEKEGTENLRQLNKIHSFVGEEKVVRIAWHPGGKAFAAGFLNGQMKFLAVTD